MRLMRTVLMLGLVVLLWPRAARPETVLKENFEEQGKWKKGIRGDGAIELAGNLGIEMDNYNFAESSCFTPVATSRPGVYACGAFTGPTGLRQERGGRAGGARKSPDADSSPAYQKLGPRIVDRGQIGAAS